LGLLRAIRFSQLEQFGHLNREGVGNITCRPQFF